MCCVSPATYSPSFQDREEETRPSLFFPVTEEREEHQVETSVPPQTGSEQILPVDDEESILGMAQLMLESLGYRVVTTMESTKALAIFKADPGRFDLVITDQTMPNMSGAELIDEILQVRADIQIILCSGYSSKVSENRSGKRAVDMSASPIPRKYWQKRSEKYWIRKDSSCA